MRLADGETEWEGRLEVCYDGRWGTIGNDGWHSANSKVICAMLGYDFVGKLFPI